MGYDFEELFQINEMVEKLETVESMNKMIFQMNQDYLNLLKICQHQIVKDEEITIDMDDLPPVRPEDNGDDLWSVFNVIRKNH